MPTFAAIDIGSNSCRLKIAKVVAHQLKTLAEDREVTRLGASVFESGLVSPEAMALTLRALKRFQRAVQTHGVDQVRVVATSAMRDARNGAAFQAWVKAETGWNMEIISGLEEGRLIHLGVTGAEPGAGGKVLLIDLGGGSCEITLSEHKRIKETISVPLGAVRLTEDFLPADPAPADGLGRMRQWIAKELRRAHKKIQPGKVPLVIATSGTAAALSDAYAAGVRLNKPASQRGSKSASQRGGLPEVVPTRFGAEVVFAAGEDDAAGARGGAGDWAAARRDYCGRRSGVCGADGELWAGGISLLAAWVARRHIGADAGRAGCAGVGASRV